MSNPTSRNALLITVFAVFVTGLAGCHLYLGDSEDEYCDEWGCTDSPAIDNPGGWACTSNANCAAGCYCSEYGYCEENGFCDRTSDCPAGFTCDARSSCVPDGSSEPPPGGSGEPPPGGSGEPPPTERCADDSQCSGAMICDTRGLCIPPNIDPSAATCQGPFNCSAAPPICPVGSTPAIEFYCYTGECIVNTECPDGAPVTCSDHSESACMEDATCGSVYRGVNCTSETGEECITGSMNCTCESFVFDYCE